jgi:hypothetical protein
MKKHAAAPASAKANSVTPVRIYLGGDGSIQVDPQRIVLAWEHVGTIRWTLDIEGASFDDHGIFFPLVSGFQPHRVSATEYEMHVHNDQWMFAGTHKYDIKLLDRDREIVIDPTVENDPPPPLPPAVKRRRGQPSAGAGKA